MEALASERQYAVIGDAGQWNGSAPQARQSILRQGVRSLILPGDNLYSVFQGYDAAWLPWKSKGFSFDVVAIGNHTAGYAAEVAYFAMPGEHYAVAPDALHRFIVLNSDNTRTVPQQLSWLEQELEAAQERFVFLVFHHPPLTVTSDHRWQEKTRFQIGLRALTARYRSKVTALLVGHDHIASLLTFDDLPVIVSGAAREQRKPEWIDDTQEGTRVRSRWLFEKESVWVRLSVSSGARVDFVRSADDTVQCSVDLVTGQAPLLRENCAVTGTRP